MNHQDYIDAEFRVFGLYGAQTGLCECGDFHCKALYKHPRISNWQHTPEWSDEQLEVMAATGSFDTGFGVLVNGWLIIDVDARNGGVESFNKLCQTLGMDLLGDCGFAVRTGSGGGSMHLYFQAPSVALRQSLVEYPGVDFKSSGFVVGAGSLHASGARYEVIHGAPIEVTNAPASLLELLKKQDTHRTSVRGSTMDVADDDLRAMVSCIPPDCDYETWYKAGMAIHHATGGTAFEIWDDWSLNGTKYPGRDVMQKKWHSFGKTSNPVTLGTLIHFAEENGYQQPVTFEADLPILATAKEVGDHPFSIAGVDLLRPPGFVGQITKWIDNQCRYPRQHLAVAAALSAIGNIVGLRYTDDLDGVTSNLFAFCVAASATGKEAVQQAMAELHRAAGIQAATHGSIKSEQEIVRNLIRHQASLYIVDEIGILLTKIVNAQKRGGAVYLDGVIGMLMAAYSKADSFMLLTGDTKEEVRRALMAELSQARKMVSENEDKGGIAARRIPQLERAISNIDNGLERPFLSVVGFTTPVTFNDIVTFEQATNGFIGRSLLIKELETNPKARRGFKKTPITEQMRATLQNLYAPGVFSADHGRIEYYGDRIRIKTDAEGQAMLAQVLDWLEDYAERQKSMTGLEAIVRRGYELMAKVSLILAAPEGLRTAEHVRWAYAIMRRDIDEKINLAHANISEKHDPATALMQRILGMIDHEHAERTGVIVNRCRPRKKDEVIQALVKLEEGGRIRRIMVTSETNGQQAEKWLKIGTA